MKILLSQYEQGSSDKSLSLDNLLIQLRDEVTPHWYEFGLTVGVPQEFLDKCSDYPPYQCIVEVLDYWLKHHCGQLTWRDVAHALKKINLYQLAEKILQIYETGDPNTCCIPCTLVRKLNVIHLGKATIDVDIGTDVNIKIHQSSECQHQPVTLQQNLNPALPLKSQKCGTEMKIAMSSISNSHHHNPADSTSPPPLPPKCKN